MKNWPFKRTSVFNDPYILLDIKNRVGASGKTVFLDYFRLLLFSREILKSINFYKMVSNSF